jgi:hypothetical protein
MKGDQANEDKVNKQNLIVNWLEQNSGNLEFSKPDAGKKVDDAEIARQLEESHAKADEELARFKKEQTAKDTQLAQEITMNAAMELLEEQKKQSLEADIKAIDEAYDEQNKTAVSSPEKSAKPQKTSLLGIITKELMRFNPFSSATKKNSPVSPPSSSQRD